MSRRIVPLFVALALVAAGGWFLYTTFIGGGEPEADPAHVATPAEEGPRAVAPAAEPSDVEGPAGTTRTIEPVAPTVPDRTIDSSLLDPTGPSGSLSGRVVNDRGEAIESAKVTLFVGPENLMVKLPGARAEIGRGATTDSDGTYHFDDLRPASNYVVVASHPEYAQGEFDGAQVRSGDVSLVPNVVLTAGYSVTGVVTDRGGSPLPGATVEIFDLLAVNFSDPADRKAWASTVTDGSGRYGFPLVHFGSCEVVASREGYSTIARTQMLLFGKLEDKQIDFALHPALAIRGVVVDENGQPVEDAKVEAMQIAAAPGADVALARGSGRSGRDGGFLVPSLAEGNYTVKAACPGYSDEHQTRIEAGNHQLRLTMKRRGAVEGKVVDEATGQPVARFRIQVMRAPEGAEPVPMNKSRDFEAADGSFTFDDVEPGVYVLEAEVKGYAPSRSLPVNVDRGVVTRGVTVALNRGGSLVGLASDGSGNPVAGARVKLNTNNYTSNPISEMFLAMPNVPKQRVHSTRTGSDGRFTLELIVPGTYQVEVAKSEFSPFARNDVEIRKGEQVDVGRLVLTQGGVVRGSCIDAAGRPFKDGTVNLTGSGRYATAKLDFDGRFEFKNLPEGNYDLTAQPEHIDGKPVNPLFRMVYSQKTKSTVFVGEGQLVQVQLQLPPE